MAETEKLDPLDPKVSGLRLRKSRKTSRDMARLATFDGISRAGPPPHQGTEVLPFIAYSWGNFRVRRN